jgi:hypothetical protein
MSITIKLSPLANPIPGHGFLHVRGWEHDAGNLEFALQRNQDDYYLQHDRQWGNAPCWFAQHFEEAADGDSISYQVGPEIVDPLLQNSATGVFNFRLRSPDGSGEDENPMKLMEGLALSGAGNATGPGAAQTTVSLAPTPAAQAPAIVQPAVEPLSEAEVEPAPTVEPAPRASAKSGKSRIVWLAVVILALLAIAAGLWLWLKQPSVAVPVVAPTPPTTVPGPARTTAAPCSAEALSSENELNFVQGCIKQSPDSAALLKVIELAKANKQCGVAQRLYANRAQAGNVDVALAYAREYDPKYLQASDCFKTADNATAAYWYETILGYQADNAEAAQRLKELKP